MWYEIDSENAINTDETWRVELDDEKVEWRSSGDKKIERDYGSHAAAQAAYDAFLLFNSTPGGLAVGDAVAVSLHHHARGALGDEIDAVLVAFPTVAFPFWVLDVASQVMYVDNVTVSKLI